MKNVVRFSFRKLLLVMFVLAVVGGLTYHFWPKPTAVETAVIANGDLSVTLEADGETRVRDRYLITAPVAGLLRRVELHAGESVAPGQVLARIEPVLLDPTTLEQAKLAYRAAAARVEQAESAASAAQTVLDRASERHRSLNELHQANDRLATRQQVDDAWAEVQVKQNALKEAQKALAAVRFEYQRARAAIPRRQWTEDLDRPTENRQDAESSNRPPPAVEEPDQTLLTSPLEVPARVLQIHQQGPATVALGTPIMEIGDSSTIEVAVDLLTADAVKIAPGAQVTLEGWGGKTLTGVVDRIDPKAFTKPSPLGVEEKRVNVFVRIENADAALSELGDGFSVQANILVSQQRNVTLAPIGALFRPSQEWAVYLLEGERAQLRTVKLGERNDLYAQVIEGLSPGDVVVMHPGESLKPGAWIRPSTTPASPPADDEAPAAQLSRVTAP